ncbi:MAG: hypothetical protein JW881_14975 [Spirochaetales bacterium]|nr:hypothetical protein [Spirochaetales bacterium]
MKKIWAFIEGDSEEAFIENLLRNNYYNTIQLVKDISVFITTVPQSPFSYYLYCENCGGVDKIPYRINEMYYQIEKSESDKILILCDIEKLKCHSIRKKEIESRLDTVIEDTFIKYIFFNPKIESLYWDCPHTLKRVIEVFYKKKYNNTINVDIPSPISNCLYDLKMLLRKYGLTYRENRFAAEFFPRIRNYRECGNEVVKRIIGFLDYLS